MNSWELQEEREIAKLFRRPERRYIFDKPFYPYVPPSDKFMVNFDLNPPQ